MQEKNKCFFLKNNKVKQGTLKGSTYTLNNDNTIKHNSKLIIEYKNKLVFRKRKHIYENESIALLQLTLNHLNKTYKKLIKLKELKKNNHYNTLFNTILNLKREIKLETNTRLP